jgi:hypothetical protein
MREHVRAARPALDAFDIVLRVRRGLRAEDVTRAAAESRELLTRLIARTRQHAEA